MVASYKKLFKLLIDREMKSKELAVRAGVSQATLAKMKKDGATVSSDVLVKICMALDCTLNDIVEIISEEKPKPIYTGTTTFKLGELFCGPGGIACGAMSARSADGKLMIEHAWANDYDADTCETYRKNICPDAPQTVYCGDVRELDIKSLGEIDAFCYGFPCNSFSNVGKHQGLENEKFGQLYWYGIEVLKTYKPKGFVAENVSGIRSAGSGDFDIILNDMREAGYRLNVNLYKAEQYGVPQTRHRVFFIATRNDFDLEGLDMSFNYEPIRYGEIKSGNGFPINTNTETYRILQMAKPCDLRMSDVYVRIGEKERAFACKIAWEENVLQTFIANMEYVRGTDKQWLSVEDIIHGQTFPEDYEFDQRTHRSVGYICGMSVPPIMMKRVVTRLIESGVFE